MSGHFTELIVLLLEVPPLFCPGKKFKKQLLRCSWEMRSSSQEQRIEITKYPGGWNEKYVIIR